MQSTIDEFSSITRASAKQARGVLREAQGDLRQALDIWYSRGMVPDTVYVHAIATPLPPIVTSVGLFPCFRVPCCGQQTKNR